MRVDWLCSKCSIVRKLCEFESWNIQGSSVERKFGCVQDLVKMQDELLQKSQRNHATCLDNRIAKKQKEKEVQVKDFEENDLVITVRDVVSKLDYKWKGSYKVIKKLFANVFELEDLRTKKRISRDVSSLRAFVCPEGVDPVSIAGQDEGEYVVRSIEGRRLEGTKKMNKTHWYFLVKFEDGSEDWLPYMEVRDLEAFEEYLRNHRGFARMLKLKVSAQSVVGWSSDV